MWLNREIDLTLPERDPEWEEFVFEEMLQFYEECGYSEVLTSEEKCSKIEFVNEK
jgi:hypothetical protein